MQTTNQQPTFNPADRNARPYCVSLDWLSISGRDTGFILFNCEQQPSGYKLVPMGHGSKVFRTLYTIYDPDGIEIGELHAHPYQKGMDEHCVIVKAANALLYEPDGVEQFFACISALAIYYKGINRLDIACDQNEFYGGRKIESLMDGYFSENREILKLGCNAGINYFDQGYWGVQGKNGFQMWTKKPLCSEEKRKEEYNRLVKKNEELAKCGLPLIDVTPPHVTAEPKRERYRSVTWGTRSAPVQVQLYNKTKELQEKTLKHYIVDAWKNAGLDVSRTVWRVEIRIQGRGKGLVNPSTGKEFVVNLIDLVLQQQVEDFFFAFAERHFQFFTNTGHVKLRQNTPIKLWHRAPALLKCKQTKTVKDPNRFIQVVYNALVKESNALIDFVEREKDAGREPSFTNESAALIRVADYFKSAYDLENWAREKQIEIRKQELAMLHGLDCNERAERTWYGSLVEQVQHKIDILKGRSRDICEEVSLPSFTSAVEKSLRTLTYVEKLPQMEWPYTPPPEKDNELPPEQIEIDWDSFND